MFSPLEILTLCFDTLKDDNVGPLFIHIDACLSHFDKNFSTVEVFFYPSEMRLLLLLKNSSILSWNLV